MLGWTAGARRAGRWQYVCGAVLLTGFIAGAAALPASSGKAAAASPGYSISLLQTGPFQQFVAVNPASGKVYFGGVRSAQLTIAGEATGLVSGTVSLAGNARNVAVDASTGDIWVSEAGSAGQAGSVQAINGATDAVIATIPLSFEANGIAVDDATDMVYVGGSNATAGAVAVIDGATKSVMTTISTGTGSRPSAVAVDDTSDVIWVADQAGTLIALDGASNAISGTVSLGPSDPVSVAVDPGTGRAYVVDRKNADIAVIGGTPPAVITTIPLGPNAFGIALDPGTHTIFATSNPTNSPVSLGTTWVVDTSNRAITDTLTRGGDGVAVDQATGSLPAGVTLLAGGTLAGTAAAGTGGRTDWFGTVFGTAGFTLTVDRTPAFSSGAKATFVAGHRKSVTIKTTGFPVAAVSELGKLPRGVKFTAHANGTATLTGTPASSASGRTFVLTLTATSSAGAVRQTFRLLVT